MRSSMHSVVGAQEIQPNAAAICNPDRSPASMINAEQFGTIFEEINPKRIAKTLTEAARKEVVRIVTQN
jgi:hypothetical protein